ncbi:MAG TPA: tetratricopeptide repeat protein [Pseudolabrys sp.]
MLAVVQSCLGKNELALANYDRALVLQPRHAEALSNRGNALKALGRFDLALKSYDRAILFQPDYATAHSNRGAVLSVLKRPEDALASYDRALALRPDHVEAHYNRGHVLNELKRHAEALASYDRVLALRPDFVEAYSNRGNALNALKRHDEALASYDRALALRPDLAEAHCNRGNASHALGRFDEALVSFERALALRPDYAEAHYNRGATLHELKRYDEALASYDRAIAAKPDYAAAYSNRGASLYELRRFDEALASYDRALIADPDYPEAHWNAASLRLLTGDFARGWAEYEWRWTYERMAPARRDFKQPLWCGTDDIAGKMVLLTSEQGFGDTIQFSRFATGVAARGARVVLEVEKPLQRLMRSLAGPAEVLTKGSPLPEFDLHCPLLSLPLAFGTELATIPAQTPYLSAPASAAATWEARLPRGGRRTIGLSWSGNAMHVRDKNRSIDLAGLLPLLDVDATFVSVQKDMRPADAALLTERGDIRHFGASLDDFAETAALVAQLDLIISVDTSAAHLAGALGKPVWVLLPRIPDWRWLLDRDDSPWYPTARLFRQDDTATWDGVIVRVREALFAFVRSEGLLPAGR